MITHTHLSQFTWPRTVIGTASSALAAVVFAFLDVVDLFLCFVYSFLDGFFEENTMSCYCHKSNSGGMEDEEVSDTLYERRSPCRDVMMRFVALVMRRSTSLEKEQCTARSPRWSDCSCESCGAWRRSGADCRLHFVVKELAEKATTGVSTVNDEFTEDAMFIHGFGSSSSFWTETVFPESEILNCRMFAVDLLGFGKSPKPANCMYRLKDHVEMIERTIVDSLKLSSFHLVSHSMGCIIALALAAKYATRVKSITLVAPPYFQPYEEKATQVALNRVAKKELWPPLVFGSAVMSWYEHIGRTVCVLLCKNHLVWEWLFKLLTRKRDVDFLLRDLTKHTHHSAWHTMHNVICGGAKQQEKNLEVIEVAGIPVKIIHGDKDQVVPIECSHNMKKKLPRAELHIFGGCDHNTVVVGSGKNFAEDLKAFWSGSQKQSLYQSVQVNGC